MPFTLRTISRDVFLDTGYGGDLVENAVDLDVRYRNAGKRAEQHSAQRIAEGYAVASLKRLDNECFRFCRLHQVTVAILGFSISIIIITLLFINKCYVCQLVSDRIAASGYAACRVPRDKRRRGRLLLGIKLDDELFVEREVNVLAPGSDDHLRGEHSSVSTSSHFGAMTDCHVLDELLELLGGAALLAEGDDVARLKNDRRECLPSYR